METRRDGSAAATFLVGKATRRGRGGGEGGGGGGLRSWVSEEGAAVELSWVLRAEMEGEGKVGSGDDEDDAVKEGKVDREERKEE